MDRSSEGARIPESNSSYVSLLTEGALSGVTKTVAGQHPNSTRNSGNKSITARLMNITTEHNLAELDGTINSSNSASFVVNLMQRKTPNAAKIGATVNSYRTIEEARVRGTSE